jgi:hypothetical protein
MSVFDIDPKSDFSIYNVPFGVFALKDGIRRCATRFGKLL